MGTAQVAGIAMLAAARRRIPVALHTPSEVKAAVTGRARRQDPGAADGRAPRGSPAARPADAADALALAMCHLWRPAGALAAPQRALVDDGRAAGVGGRGARGPDARG